MVLVRCNFSDFHKLALLASETIGQNIALLDTATTLPYPLQLVDTTSVVHPPKCLVQERNAYTVGSDFHTPV